jgi:hypothetical protein
LTIRIDVDDDGTTDAKVPLKWAIIALSALLCVCGLTRSGVLAPLL